MAASRAEESARPAGHASGRRVYASARYALRLSGLAIALSFAVLGLSRAPYDAGLNLEPRPDSLEYAVVAYRLAACEPPTLPIGEHTYPSLKRLVADLTPRQGHARGGPPPKELRPAQGRELVGWFLVTFQTDIRRACGLAPFSPGPGIADPGPGLDGYGPSRARPWTAEAALRLYFWVALVFAGDVTHG